MGLDKFGDLVKWGNETNKEQKMKELNLKDLIKARECLENSRKELKQLEELGILAISDDMEESLDDLDFELNALEKLHFGELE